MTDRRDQYICAALAGLLANTDTEGAMQYIAADAVNLATAALAAAGEKESAFRDLYSVTINGVEYSTTNKALVDEIARLRAELAETQRELVGTCNVLEAARNELTRYTGPLTDEMRHALYADTDFCVAMDTNNIDMIDAAIRKVRAGEGEE